MDTENSIYGKIYKITDDGGNICYIGSTIMALSERYARHIASYKRYSSGAIARASKVRDFLA